MNMRLTLEQFMEMTEVFPIIAAPKNEEWLKACAKAECEIVYLLYGDICNIVENVQFLKDAGKRVIVHIDLITGFSAKEICVDFIKKFTRADGITSMKPIMIKRAKELGLFTIQRFFMMDAINYQNIVKYVKTSDPDVVEFLPAGLTKIIGYLLDEIDKPVIAGGLVMDEGDVMGALKVGAIAITTTNQALWRG